MGIVVLYVLLIISFGVIKKVNTYDAFLEGVENSFTTIKNIFPNLLAIILIPHKHLSHFFHFLSIVVFLLYFKIF